MSSAAVRTILAVTLILATVIAMPIWAQSGTSSALAGVVADKGGVVIQMPRWRPSR